MVMESDVQTQIDLAYQNMMAARTETAERYWCDQLKWWASKRKEVDTKKPQTQL